MPTKDPAIDDYIAAYQAWKAAVAAHAQLLRDQAEGLAISEEVVQAAVREAQRAYLRFREATAALVPPGSAKDSKEGAP